MSANLADEGSDIRRACIVVEQFVVQVQSTGPGGSNQGGQGRDPLVAIPGSLDRRLAQRCPHASPHLEAGEDQDRSLSGRWVNSQHLLPGDLLFCRDRTARPVQRLRASAHFGAPW